MGEGPAVNKQIGCMLSAKDIVSGNIASHLAQATHKYYKPAVRLPLAQHPVISVSWGNMDNG